MIKNGNTIVNMDESYIAGFFDGEGSAMIITIKRQTLHGTTYQFRPIIKISQKTPNVLFKIKETMGFGRVVKDKKVYAFVICGNKNICEFIIKISPFTFIKTDVLLELNKLINKQNVCGNIPYTRETIEEMIDIRDAVKKLNNITRSTIHTNYSKETILKTMSFPELISWNENRTLNRIIGVKSFHKTKNDSKINPTIKCACGCGGEFLKFDKQHRERKFIHGHNIRKKRWRWYTCT